MYDNAGQMMSERPPGGLWVFAYGSLIWRPGFAHVEAQPATVHGYHRALCIRSDVYRGTPDVPGLVFGLDRGGACKGMAFRVADADVGAATQVIWAREMVTGVYQPRWLKARLGTGASARQTTVWAFVAERRHDQYVGRLSDTETVRLVRQGQGQAGPCLEYLVNTLAHLDGLGLHDAGLARIVRLAAKP